MKFLRNAWYVVSWADDLTDEPLPITVMGEELVVFRAEDNRPAALQDRCPHRFAPLSLGKIHGAAIVCPYHGLHFNGAGQCVRNPHPTGKFGDTMRVKSFPVVEKHRAIWIWMGEDEPDHEAVPDLTFMDQPETYTAVSGHFEFEANYALMNDNLLDLTHVPILHDGNVGNADMMENLDHGVESDGGAVTLTRVNVGIEAAPVYQRFYPEYRGMKVDKHQVMRWTPPSHLVLEITHHGTGEPDLVRRTAYTYNLITPMTETRSHYFWAQCRDHGHGDHAFDELVRSAIAKAFIEEDAAMVERQQRAMGTADFMALRPSLIPTDSASIIARRMLGKLIRNEELDMTESFASDGGECAQDAVGVGNEIPAGILP